MICHCLWSGHETKCCMLYILCSYYHYVDVIMSTMAFQITSVSIVYSTICSSPDRRKHQSPGEYPAQRANNAKNVSIWWRHHDIYDNEIFRYIVGVHYEPSSTQTGLLVNPTIFSCDQAALWMVQSVRPSVRLSVCLSVCMSHLFDYVPNIVLSWNFQELLPMTKMTSMQKVKVRGQRSRSQRSTPNLSVSGL